jgi:hypothetical protein
MLSFRNSMGFIAVAALAVAIGMLMHSQQDSNRSAHVALAVVGSPVGDLKRIVVKAPEHWFPRASTYASEMANTNHEGH